MTTPATSRSPRRLHIAWTLCLCLLAPCAGAQVPLPGGVQLPQVDARDLPVPVRDPLDSSLDRVSRELSGLRQLQIRELLRTQRALVDRDADGAPVLRGEVLAIAASATQLQLLAEAGFTTSHVQALDGLDLHATVLRAPPRMSTRAAIRLARRLDPEGSYDYNHLYLRSAQSATPPAPLSGRTRPAATSEEAALRVGLVDSGVDPDHPALASVRVQRWGCGGRHVADAHGTAVGSLLVGNAVAGARGGGTLFAADVYCGRPASGAASELAQALAWMARERVAVVNISLVGPRNALVERAIAAMSARGHVIVAAVGNDGPAAPPLFPAAYAEVIGVTAVDARRRLLPEAGRGTQVDFAAPGLGLYAAAPQQRWQQVRGTSYAAPLVARLAARVLDAPDPNRGRDAVLARLAAEATAPADPRRERYGRGIVGLDLPIMAPPQAPAR